MSDKLKTELRESRWIDISMPIRSGMLVWPGDPEVWVERVADVGKGDACNVSRIAMGTHTGTHMDAPLHFFAHGDGIDAMPSEVGIGPARIIQIEDARKITADELRRNGPQRGERLLFRTRNSEVGHEPPFREDFVYLGRDAAQLLADAGVALVGIDYMSIGAFAGEEGEETHRILLSAGIWVIENLVLGSVDAGEHDLVCLPLRISGGDGAPCRAMVRKR